MRCLTLKSSAATLLSGLAVLGSIASADKLRSFQITALGGVETVTVPKGCEKAFKNRFGFTRHQAVDCFGVLLKNVAGRNQGGFEEELGDVLLFGGTDDRAAVDEVTRYILDSTRAAPGDFSKVSFSPLKVSDEPITLAGKIAHFGGIGLTVQSKSGFQTIKVGQLAPAE